MVKQIARLGYSENRGRKDISDAVVSAIGKTAVQSLQLLADFDSGGQLFPIRTSTGADREQ